MLQISGTIQEAKDSKQEAEIESLIEKIDADLYSEKIKTGETPTRSKLIEIINNSYGTVNEDGYSFTSKDGNYVIQFEDITGWKDDLNIGDTVSYTPTNATYTWLGKYSGEGEGTDTTLDNAGDFSVTTWKVFDIKDNGMVELISAEPTTGTVYLGDAQGYNNGVKLLNDACNELYGNDDKGITGRSINIDDIEGKMTKDALTEAHSYSNGDATYGTQISSEYTTHKNYPIIYEQEKYSVINRTENTTGLGASQQTKFIEQTENGAMNGKLTASLSIQPYQTHWYEDNNYMQSAFLGEGINTENENYNLIMPNGAGTRYHLATRDIYATSNICGFGLRFVSSGNISAHTLYNSGGYTNSNTFPIRPIIYLNSSLLEKNDTGWSIK